MRVARLLLPLVFVLLLAGCSNGYARYTVRDRSASSCHLASLSASQLRAQYAAEDDYLKERRKAVGSEEPARWGNLKGIALSGGGIRSATFSLGVLQALALSGTLDEYDYVSGTSGGAYTTAWLLAHYTVDDRWLCQAPGMRILPDGSAIDERGWEVRAASLRSLLLGPRDAGCTDISCDDQLLALQTHSGFLSRGRMTEPVYWLWSYLWRLPFSMLFDVAIHTKSDWNWYHLISVYSDRIGRTYLDGLHDVPLIELNRRGSDAPYGIINGNFLNGECAGSSNSFEFTADTSGADAIGYIDSQALGALPTGEVEPVEGGRRVWLRAACAQEPVRSTALSCAGIRSRPYVTREHESDDPSIAQAASDDGSAASRLFCAEPLRLRDAVAASGAAFDPDGALTRVDNFVVRGAAAQVAAPFNLNLGLETWNYSSALFRANAPEGYAWMQSYERICNPGPEARWLKITDGGHFENTSVFSLLRRGVSTILAVDAGADPMEGSGPEFADRSRLAEHVENQLGLLPRDASTGWRSTRTELYSGAKPDAERIAVIHWIKPSLDGMCDNPVLAPKACGSRSEDFPHTTTLQQVYSIEEFEAYRALGEVQACQRSELMSCEKERAQG